ncbi:MAG: 1-acyl-sn-glycerol-3-phosphate acyltransferase [Desulfovibrio sp.]|nr:1-acyl-sn-glycerol-3-phosphate acyltransferase [Desulfovibrio sp.]
MKILANVLIFLIYLTWTLLVFPLALTCLLGLSQKPALQSFSRRVSWFYGRYLVYLLSPLLPCEFKNKDYARKVAPCIIVANHQSFLDLFLMGLQNESNLCMVSRSWPYSKLFFYAPLMWSGGYIDAEKLPFERVLQLFEQRLKEGASLVIYPEGHRSKDGKLQKFHGGAFYLACKTKRPIVPLVIHDSYKILGPGTKLLSPKTIHLEMLKPIYPEAFLSETKTLPHRAMTRKVHALMQKALCQTSEIAS